MPLRLHAAVALAAFLCAACLGRPFYPIDPGAPLDGAETRFVAFGDSGTGTAAQWQVAQAMADVCLARNCSFALMLGDNFYERGVTSKDDPQFEDKFEEPYASLDLPFFVVLGNHDNAGATSDPDAANATGVGDFQVAYSKRDDRLSERWHMPARHYDIELGNISLLALDTNTFLHANGTRQKEWIDDAIDGANGPWRIAIGHHPYLSNGRHGNAGAYDGRPDEGFAGKRFKEFFDRHLCDEVDLYLAGHDHNLQWLEPIPECGKTQFVVSGGGGASTYDLPGNNRAAFERQTLGFWWFEATPDTLRGVAYDAEGNALFERTLTK